jgi:hypothetical protein
MKLDLTNNDLKIAISEAILTQINTEARDQLIREALQQILEPKRDTYGRVTSSPIQEAFADSCSRLMREIVEKLISEDPDVRKKIEDFAKSAISKLLANEDDHYKLVSSFVEAFRKSMTGERY